MNKNGPPPVSIVIPSYNGGEKIINCLESVSKLNYPGYEVIIIDNNSTDGSIQEIKKRFKKFKVIENKFNFGCAKATNQGFKASKHSLLLTLDEDVILEKNSLKNLVKIILNRGDIGAVSPKIYNYKSKKLMGLGFKINKFTGKVSVIGENQQDKGQFNEIQAVDYIPGAVVLAKKEVIDKIKGMDEDYFLYYGDAQYSLDIRKAGYKIFYVPNALAWHDCNTSEGFNQFRISNFIRSKLIFMRKNSSKLNLIVCMFFFFLVYTPLRILTYLIKNKLNLIAHYFKGVKAGLYLKI